MTTRDLTLVSGRLGRLRSTRARPPARPKLPKGWFLLELARTGSPGHLVLAPDGVRAPAGWRFEPAGFTPVPLDTFVRERLNGALLLDYRMAKGEIAHVTLVVSRPIEPMDPDAALEVLDRRIAEFAEGAFKVAARAMLRAVMVKRGASLAIADDLAKVHAWIERVDEIEL